MSAQDLHKDAVMDLHLRMKEDKEINEYVRLCSVKPLAVVLFSELQLEIVKTLRKVTGKVVAHLDATGSVVQKLEKKDKKQFLLYAVAVKSPLTGEPPVAVCQFVLSDQSQGSIEHALNCFLLA